MRLLTGTVLVALLATQFLTAADKPAAKKKASASHATKKPAPTKAIAKKTPVKTVSKTAAKPPSKTTRRTAATSKSASKTTSKSGKKPVAIAPRRSMQQQPSAGRYKEIQQALADKGYFSGSADGNWGSESVDALKRFQRDQNLAEDGKIGSLSLIALGLGPQRLAAAGSPKSAQ